jgi:hypothetical protein
VILPDQRHDSANPGCILAAARLFIIGIKINLTASVQSFFRESESDALGAGRPVKMKEMNSIKLWYDRTFGIIDTGHCKNSLNLNSIFLYCFAYNRTLQEINAKQYINDQEERETSKI